METLNIVEETALEFFDSISDENYIIGISESSLKLFDILREKGIRIKGFIDYSSGEIRIYETVYTVISFDECESATITNAFEVYSVTTPLYSLRRICTLIRVAPFVVEHAYGMQTKRNGIEQIGSMVAPTASIFADSSSKIIITNSIIYPRVNIHVQNESEVIINGSVLKEDVSISAKQKSKITINEGVVIDRDAEIVAHLGSDIYLNKEVKLERYVSLIAMYKSRLVIDKYVLLMKYVTVHSKCNSNVLIGKDTFLNYYDILASYDAEISIGEECMLAPHVSGIVGYHSIKAIDDEEWNRNIENKKSIKVGNHVWLGVGVILLPGTDIREGSMLGAGTIANSTVPPNVCCVGEKCTIIKESIYWEA
jgi:maltose O-acetyltransferase